MLVLGRPHVHGRLLVVGDLVLLVGDRFEPRGGVAPVRQGLEHGEVAHEGVGGGAVPVVLAGRADDGLAGADAEHRTVAGTDEADSLGDVQGLADGVGVPVGVGAGGEADQCDGHPRRLFSLVDRGDVDVAGEVRRRCLGGRVDGLEFHGGSWQRKGQGFNRVLMARRSSMAR